MQKCQHLVDKKYSYTLRVYTFSCVSWIKKKKSRRR